MSDKTGLVTGASGYIALHVVDQLLEAGWTVHATVRSLQNARKVQPLQDLSAKYPGKLQLFEADLLVPGSFLPAMKGCGVVFHVASPFIMPEHTRNPQKQLIEPALQGTRNVLGSVNETESVTRVVLTSSSMNHPFFTCSYPHLFSRRRASINWTNWLTDLCFQPQPAPCTATKQRC